MRPCYWSDDPEITPLRAEEEDGRMAVQRNLEKWKYTLERSTSTLIELGRISPRYLARVSGDV